MVLFGVTGDLSRKKVMPAIYDLANRGLLPPGFSLAGFARRDWADEDFAQVVHDSVKEHARTEFREEVWKQLAEGFRFVPGDFDDDVAFNTLRRTIEELDEVRGTGGNHAFYLAIPPGVLRRRRRPAQGARPGRAGADGSWRRVVVEKPFGHDLRVGARAERHAGRRSSRPASIFRIDHYLGKETVQNILAMRFANDDVRADLELQLRRPRADHDGRGHRHRRPRRLLRRHRRRPRRDPEPPDAADVAGRDGGADVVRRREPAHREAEAALGGHPAPPARPDHRARAVRRRLGRAARRSSASSRRRASARPRPPRRTPR